MVILGINAYHGDASAAVVVDGQLVAAAEEERFNRTKHWAGVPVEAVRYCLEAAGARIEDVDHLAVSRNPSAHLHRKILFTLAKRPSIGLVRDRLANAGRVRDVWQAVAEGLGVAADRIRAARHRVEHHRAHMASAFLVSPFERAACCSVDGFGDFVSAMWGVGEGTRITPFGSVAFPHSLGLFYTAVTQYLGFHKYGDEYKVMGLAAYGEPEYLDGFREIVRAGPRGFRLDLDYFVHHLNGVAMTWDGGEPQLGRVYSDAFARRFGPARQPDEAVERRHENIAASAQALTEEIYFHLLRRLGEKTGLETLCLAGGVAFNSVANGKIFDQTPFKELFVQPAAGDAGTALGAAFHVWNSLLNKARGFVMRHASWGPSYTDAEIRRVLEGRQEEVARAGGLVRACEDDEQLVEFTADALAAGKVVGWFQGRMEWGPRALGNRSILADPRRAEMKDVLNVRIKRREPFRPFCPSVLEERAGEYFEQSYPEPFMVKVYRIRREKQSFVPAITHVDGTGRLQMVSQEVTPLYWRLINAFDKRTGVPLLLNTSFNENEPIVMTPDEALDCFLRTRMDLLVIGHHVVTRSEQ